jgi:hypothetical protein
MALQSKELLEREPLRPLSDPKDQKRFILVTPQIDALLDGHTMYGAFPTHDAEVLVGRFAAGYLLVSRKKTKLQPQVERLENQDEVWALCIRRPKPGWRILGRFYEANVFVAFRAWDKHQLAGHYNQASQEILDDWRDFFGSREPHRGNSVGDYLCQVFKDVDEKP